MTIIILNNLMAAVNHKLIEVMKKRLSIMNQHKYYFSKDYQPISIFKLRNSRDYQDSKIDMSKKHDRKYFLLQDQINLRIVPLIKKNKCVFKYENLMLMKSPDKKSNKGVSTSFGITPSKTYTKKILFKSPFQEGKKNKKNLQIMVDLSKEFRSPKYKEKNIHKDIVKTFSRNSNILKNKNNKLYLKTYGNEKHIFNNIKLNDSDDNNEKSNHKNLNNGDYKKEKIFLRNIIINKERNRRAKNYYNQIHVNKMNKIIEKFSFNNLD